MYCDVFYTAMYRDTSELMYRHPSDPNGPPALAHPWADIIIIIIISFVGSRRSYAGGPFEGTAVVYGSAKSAARLHGSPM